MAIIKACVVQAGSIALDTSATVDKAEKFIAEAGRLGAKTSTMSLLWRAWGRYKDVAHFCAAFTSVFDEARRESIEMLDERMKRGFDDDLHETLSLVAAYQRFGTSFTPRAIEGPLIDPTRAWLLRGIEPHAKFLPPPLPLEMLTAAQRYRAPINSAYR